MADIYEKVSDDEIKVIKTEQPKKVTNIYSLEFLIKQRQAIIDQKNRDNEQRDKELAEIDEIIAECDKLGVVVNETPEKSV